MQDQHIQPHPEYFQHVLIAANVAQVTWTIAWAGSLMIHLDSVHRSVYTGVQVREAPDDRRWPEEPHVYLQYVLMAGLASVGARERVLGLVIVLLLAFTRVPSHLWRLGGLVTTLNFSRWRSTYISSAVCAHWTVHGITGVIALINYYCYL